MAVKIIYKNGSSSFFLGNSAGHLSRTLFQTSKMNIFRAVLALLCIVALQAVIAVPIPDETSDIKHSTQCSKEELFHQIKSLLHADSNRCKYSLSDPSISDFLEGLPSKVYAEAEASCSRKHQDSKGDAHCNCVARQLYVWSFTSYRKYS